MIQDFKFALRQLLKAPGFTAVAVLTLGLAIGVNSAIFALINSVVLHPMVPLRPQEVVNVFNCRQNANHDYRQFSYNEYRELRENSADVFVDLAALEFAVAGIGRDQEMRRSFAFLTSQNYFSLMGAQAFRGRFYNAEECKPNANIAVVVASYGFWKRQSGRDDFVSSTLQINGQPYTVIGITPDGFSGASAVMAQIALSLMLLFAAGLFFRGALKAAGLNPGFVAAGDLITEMDFTLVKKEPADARREIFNIAQRARELPGVTAVGVATMLPYNNFTNTRRIMSTRTILSNDPKAPDPGATALYTASTPGYFDAIGVKLLRGRDFTQAECQDKDGRRVAIIDEEMVKKLFPNEDVIGQHVRYTIPPKDGSPNDMEVIGVVGKHRHDVQNDTPLTRLFVPFAQGYSGNVVLHVRFNTLDRQAVVGMIPTIRSTLREIDPDLPLLTIAPWVDLMERSVGLWIVKLGATLFGAFGAIALLLAVVGVYGVKAYAVACRTREIGIRMALGAHRKDVFALIMRQGAMQTALAVSVGLLLSLGAGRVLSQILYEVSPSDPFALISSSLLLAVAALLACFLPARRAMHVNPITALRTE